MKKKVGILTINDYDNYGNRLQNYAVQEVLSFFGFDVVTIVNITKIKKPGFFRRINRIKNYSINELQNKIRIKFYNKIYYGKMEKRINRFKEFSHKYINETSYTISINNIPHDLDSKFDYFITGSDQVWNPTFARFSEIDFLTFAKPSKRISYAASFGISFIPTEYKDSFKKWISEMQHLSVREEAGAKIIRELTGRESQVLIDPTLMLSKDKWLSISSESVNKPADKYLLTYFLGEVSKEDRRSIKEIALKNKLKIINLASIYDLDFYDADPSEFIDLINSASVVFTDSFHGVIFSILFEKPFVVFERKSVYSMSSRIDTLLSKFKLESRRWENIKDTDDIFNIDFSHVPEILEAERKKALDYLKNALEIKDVE